MQGAVHRIWQRRHWLQDLNFALFAACAVLGSLSQIIQIIGQWALKCQDHDSAPGKCWKRLKGKNPEGKTSETSHKKAIFREDIEDFQIPEILKNQ